MIVPATREHVSQLYPDFPDYSMRAFSMIMEDKVQAIVGIYYTPMYAVAFLSSTDKAWKWKKECILLSRYAVKLFDKQRVYAYQDAALPTAPGLLKHFGFIPLGGGLWLRQ